MSQECRAKSVQHSLKCDAMLPGEGELFYIAFCCTLKFLLLYLIVGYYLEQRLQGCGHITSVHKELQLKSSQATP